MSERALPAMAQPRPVDVVEIEARREAFLAWLIFVRRVFSEIVFIGGLAMLLFGLACFLKLALGPS